MARQPIPPTERAFNQLWVVALTRHLGMDVRDLDAQLTMEPIDGQPFVAYANPAPWPRRLAPRMFQQAYRDGRNPNHRQWRDPITDAPFNLSARVDHHVLGASDWLLEGLRGYMSNDAFPSLSCCQTRRDTCLSRLQLARWPAEVGFLALRICPRDAIAVERMWCHFLSDTGHPLALQLLVSLLHERQYHYPNTPAVDRLREFATHGVARFLARDELNFCDKAKEIRDEVSLPLLQGVKRASTHGNRKRGLGDIDQGPPSPILVFGPVLEMLSGCSRSIERSTWRPRVAGAPEWQLYEEAQELHLEEGDSCMKVMLESAERTFIEALPSLRFLSQDNPVGATSRLS